MVERGSRFSFAPKAFKRLRVARQFFWQEFEANGAVQPSIFSLIDDAHPAAAESFDDAVVRNRAADHRLAGGLR